MKPIVWKEEYKLGIEEIDSQHKALVQLINEIHEGRVEGLKKEVMGKIIDRLVDYTRDHFSYEENLMSECSYPGSEDHKSGHQHFITMVENFKHMYLTQDSKLLDSIYDFLKVWLTSHILVADREYVPYVTKTGTTTDKNAFVL